MSAPDSVGIIKSNTYRVVIEVTKDKIESKYYELRDKIIESEYRRLNNMQREAVLTTQGPVLVLAGAGSGKTTVLTNRVAHLVKYGDIYKSGYLPASGITADDISLMEQHLESLERPGAVSLPGAKERMYELLCFRSVSPSSILAITFTNKAAREMKERIHKLVGSDAKDIWISTFHSLCVRILRRDIEKIGYGGNFVIYDDSDQLSVINECLKQLNLNEKYYNAKEIRALIGSLKDDLKSPLDYAKEVSGQFRQEKLAEIYKLYESMLRKHNALDFNDLLVKTLELFYLRKDILDYYRYKFRYILVDEYQDTNYAQYMIVKLLSDFHGNICVVGDDDQSIYRWRGADIRNILDFEKDFPDAKVIKLEENYRSYQNILDAANNVIRHNIGRKDKKLWTRKDKGDRIKLFKADSEKAEAEFICNEIRKLVRQGSRYGDIAILYRMNAQSRALEEAMMKYAIPYNIYGGLRFYDRMEVKDIIAYLRVIDNPADDVSLIRIINSPRRGIGDVTVSKLQEAALVNNTSMFEIMLESGESIAGKAAGSRIKEFTQLLTRLIAKKEVLPLTDFIQEVLIETGYLPALERENSEESIGRIENLKEFVSAAKEFEDNNPDSSLTEFLSNIALISDIDKMEAEDDADRTAVSLMTLHSAKGLEFPVVFLTGLEEGLFPHSRSMESDEELEEERRLCYVGITRAKTNLYITYADRRTMFGSSVLSMPSRFIKEIPEDLVDDLNSLVSCSFSHAAGLMRKDNFTSFGPRGVSFTAQEENTEGKARFCLGDKVMHTKFGTGTVIAMEGKGSDLVLKVAFVQGGIKSFLAELAPLKKV